MIRVPRTNIRSAISLGQSMKQVIETGKITRADELIFLRALSSDAALSYEDMTMLSDLMRRLDMGLIKVVDE
ncbi:MAG: hypothetical protein NW220_15230 [Leptolyngbyaceae cyanobacterium bins.349]|nr:hypothetical protein [Leptolyngbyaceae cyanobacterium bins.349]